MGGELRVWDLRSREMAAHMKMHNSRIVGAAVMADDKHVVRTRLRCGAGLVFAIPNKMHQRQKAALVLGLVLVSGLALGRCQRERRCTSGRGTSGFSVQRCAARGFVAPTGLATRQPPTVGSNSQR